MSGRPIKEGLDYFPLDVNTDDKFELIEAKHGIVGFGVIIKLLQRIYREGYYLEWNEEKLLLLKKSINVDINSINAIINDAILYKIFDKKMFDTYSILTSHGIQKRFFAACDRRKSLNLDRNLIIVDINPINVHINWINELNNAQSKVKESKEEESKVNEPQISFEHFPGLKPFELDYNETVKAFKDDTKQIELIAMNNKCETTDVESYAISFLNKLNTEQQFPRDIRDTRRYFSNWFNKNYKKSEGFSINGGKRTAPAR